MNHRGDPIFTPDCSHSISSHNTMNQRSTNYSNLAEFSVGTNKQFHGTYSQYQSQEMQVRNFKTEHETLVLEIQDSNFSDNALSNHVLSTKGFGNTDFILNSAQMNIDLAATEKELWPYLHRTDTFGESIFDAEKHANDFSLEQQVRIYDQLVKADVLKIKANTLKRSLAYNQKKIDEFNNQTNQGTEKYGETLIQKPIATYQRNELPRLQQTKIKLQDTIVQLETQLPPLKQQADEVQKKLAAFGGKTTTKIGAHVRAVFDSENSQESLTYDKRLIDERIGQLERQINRYKDAIRQVDAKIDYVRNVIQQYQETYTKQATEIRDSIDRLEGSIVKKNPMLQALDDTLTSKSAFDHKIENDLSDSSRKILNTNNAVSDLYTPTIGNATQAYLSDSIVTVVNKTAEHYDAMNSEQRVHADATIDACNNAMHTILHGSPEKAIIATTIAHEIAAAEQGFVEIFVNGVIQGLTTVVENDIHMVRHPLETLSAAGNAICDVGWFLIGTSWAEKIKTISDLSSAASGTFSELTPAQQVQQITAFVTSLLCPSPVMLAGGMHAAQVMRSAQKTIKSFEKVLQHEAKALEASRGYKITKSIASGSEKAQETQVLVQSTTNIANTIERQKAPLLNRFKEKLFPAKKEKLVAVTEHGPIKAGTELKLAHEAEEVAKIKSGSTGNQLGNAVENPLKISEPTTVQIPVNVETVVDPDKIGFFENSVKHIFRNKEGHLFDTPEHRKMLLDMVANRSNFLGIDSNGCHWYGKILPNGKQIWASVRDNGIRNGGLNEVPRSFNNNTGLCNLGK